jgi:hypothetical protein
MIESFLEATYSGNIRRARGIQGILAEKVQNDSRGVISSDMIILSVVRIRGSARPFVKKTRIQISLDETAGKGVDNSVACQFRSPVSAPLVVSSSPLIEVTRNGGQTLAKMLASIIGNHVVQEAVKLDEGNGGSAGTAGVVDYTGVAISVRSMYSRVEGARDSGKCCNSG